jgi:hypothetical protein
MYRFTPGKLYHTDKACLHEAAHCMTAAHASIPVDRVCVSGPEPFTVFLYPLQREQLAAAYAASPISSMAALGRILGCIVAGDLALGEDVHGRDLGDVGLWHDAYKRCEGLGGTAGFMRVYLAAHVAVQGFFSRSRTREVLHKLADAIDRGQDLGRHALATALQLSGAMDLEGPEWRTVLPPVGLKAHKAHVLAASRSARDAAIAALKAGDFYDAQGRRYHPSPEEIAELKRVNAQLKRGEYVPGLM